MPKPFDLLSSVPPAYPDARFLAIYSRRQARQGMLSEVDERIAAIRAALNGAGVAAQYDMAASPASESGETNRASPPIMSLDALREAFLNSPDLDSDTQGEGSRQIGVAESELVSLLQASEQPTSCLATLSREIGRLLDGLLASLRNLLAACVTPVHRFRLARAMAAGNLDGVIALMEAHDALQPRNVSLSRFLITPGRPLIPLLDALMIRGKYALVNRFPRDMVDDRDMAKRDVYASALNLYSAMKAGHREVSFAVANDVAENLTDPDAKRAMLAILANETERFYELDVNNGLRKALEGNDLVGVLGEIRRGGRLADWWPLFTFLLDNGCIRTAEYVASDKPKTPDEPCEVLDFGKSIAHLYLGLQHPGYIGSRDEKGETVAHFLAIHALGLIHDCAEGAGPYRLTVASQLVLKHLAAADKSGSTNGLTLRNTAGWTPLMLVAANIDKYPELRSFFQTFLEYALVHGLDLTQRDPANFTLLQRIVAAGEPYRELNLLKDLLRPHSTEAQSDMPIAPATAKLQHDIAFSLASELLAPDADGNTMITQAIDRGDMLLARTLQSLAKSALRCFGEADARPAGADAVRNRIQQHIDGIVDVLSPDVSDKEASAALARLADYLHVYREGWNADALGLYAALHYRILRAGTTETYSRFRSLQRELAPAEALLHPDYNLFAAAVDGGNLGFALGQAGAETSDAIQAACATVDADGNTLAHRVAKGAANEHCADLLERLTEQFPAFDLSARNNAGDSALSLILAATENDNIFTAPAVSGGNTFLKALIKRLAPKPAEARKGVGVETDAGHRMNALGTAVRLAQGKRQSLADVTDMLEARLSALITNLLSMHGAHQGEDASLSQSLDQATPEYRDITDSLRQLFMLARQLHLPLLERLADRINRMVARSAPDMANQTAELKHLLETLAASGAIDGLAAATILIDGRDNEGQVNDGTVNVRHRHVPAVLSALQNRQYGCVGHLLDFAERYGFERKNPGWAQWMWSHGYAADWNTAMDDLHLAAKSHLEEARKAFADADEIEATQAIQTAEETQALRIPDVSEMPAVATDPQPAGSAPPKKSARIFWAKQVRSLKTRFSRAGKSPQMQEPVPPSEAPVANDNRGVRNTHMDDATPLQQLFFRLAG